MPGLDGWYDLGAGRDVGGSSEGDPRMVSRSGDGSPRGVRTGFTGGSGFTSESGEVKKILETQEERTSTEVQHVEPVVRNRRAE